MEFAGGGGWGDPREREPERVRDDVVRGYVSHEAAREDYGVALSRTTSASMPPRPRYCGPRQQLHEIAYRYRRRRHLHRRHRLRRGCGGAGRRPQIHLQSGAAGRGDAGDHARPRRRVRRRRGVADPAWLDRGAQHHAGGQGRPGRSASPRAASATSTRSAGNGAATKCSTSSRRRRKCC